jgi:hypothetical protein
MEHALPGNIGSARANDTEYFSVLERSSPPLAVATVYCHSYPHAKCELTVSAPSTLQLYCGMQGIPRHAYIEVALELLIDGKLRKFRHPVHVLEKHDDSVTVGFSFGVEPELRQALEALAYRQQKHGTA